MKDKARSTNAAAGSIPAGWTPDRRFIDLKFAAPAETRPQPQQSGRPQATSAELIQKAVKILSRRK